MGATSDMQPDRFYFDQALRVIERERGEAPLFIFVYVAANHFPWTSTFRPDLTPDWKALGNAPPVDEYIRRQGMSARDYSGFLARLARAFPRESFLLVRFGDHQPAISAKLDPHEQQLRIPGPHDGMSLFLGYLPAAGHAVRTPKAILVMRRMPLRPTSQRPRSPRRSV